MWRHYAAWASSPSAVTPAVALRKSSRQFDLLTDGHLVTVIAGVGNVRTGEISMANAGHPLPLLIGKDGSTEFVEIKTGPPLGVGETEYDLTSVMLPEGSALMCYTDGLIERRNEDIAIGMERLAKAAASERNDSLPLLLGRLLDQMREEEAADDIALLAFRRVAP